MSYRGHIIIAGVANPLISHTHFDHVGEQSTLGLHRRSILISDMTTGDMTLFPARTKLLIGKGTDRRVFPTVPDATLLKGDFEYVNKFDLTSG